MVLKSEDNLRPAPQTAKKTPKAKPRDLKIVEEEIEKALSREVVSFFDVAILMLEAHDGKGWMPAIPKRRKLTADA